MPQKFPRLSVPLTVEETRALLLLAVKEKPKPLSAAQMARKIILERLGK